MHMFPMWPYSQPSLASLHVIIFYTDIITYRIDEFMTTLQHMYLKSSAYHSLICCYLQRLPHRNYNKKHFILTLSGNSVRISPWNQQIHVSHRTHSRYTLGNGEFTVIITNNSVALFCKWTIPTDWPPLVAEVSANFFLWIEGCHIVGAADPLRP
jgi:hypothetical protein